MTWVGIAICVFFLSFGIRFGLCESVRMKKAKSHLLMHLIIVDIKGGHLRKVSWIRKVSWDHPETDLRNGDLTSENSSMHNS